MKRFNFQLVIIIVLIAATLLISCGCSFFREKLPFYSHTGADNSAVAGATPAAIEPTPTPYPYKSEHYINTEKIIDTVKLSCNNPDYLLSDYDNAFCAFILNRAYLSRYCKSDSLKRLAIDLYLSFITSQEEYIFPSDITMLGDDVNELISLLLADCPEIMNLSGSYTLYAYNDSKIIQSITFNYIMPADSYYTMLKKTFLVVDTLCDEAEDMNPYERELYVYNYIIDNCRYTKSGDDVSTAYGVLVVGDALCEGYSDAFTLAMLCMGIECAQVCGNAVNNKTGLAEAHAWNKISIDGEWYNVDPTWDDYQSTKLNGSSYSFMNVTDDEFLISHTIDSLYEVDGMPECNATKYNYHVMLNRFIPANSDVKEVILGYIDSAMISNSSNNTVIAFKCELDSDFDTIIEEFSDWAVYWNSETESDRSITSIVYSYDDEMLVARYELAVSQS